MILTGISISMLLVTLVTTTFAWFSLNDNSWVDEFTIGIENTDQLLISKDGVTMKQFLTNEDLVELINGGRDDSTAINSLADVKLIPVTSLDGKNFMSQVPQFDEHSKMTVGYVTASKASYLTFKLYFTVESNGTIDETTEYPSYELRFKTEGTVETGMKPTSFTADVQNMTLGNSLVLQDGTTKRTGDVIEVNPVNALRVAVHGSEEEGSVNSDVDYIFDVADENDLGSYAIYDSLLESLGVSNQKLNSSKNAMFTYFNMLYNDALKPMGYYSEEEGPDAQKEAIGELLLKYKTNLSQSFGTFTYNEETKSYNTISIDVAIWVEGFDADNLIGLDTSEINCFLSFDIVKVNNEG